MRKEHDMNDISLRQRAADAARANEIAADEYRTAKAEEERKNSIDDLRYMLKKVLELEPDVTEPTITIEGLTFSGRCVYRDGYRDDALFLHGACPRCQEETVAEVTSLADL